MSSRKRISELKRVFPEIHDWKARRDRSIDIESAIGSLSWRVRVAAALTAILVYTWRLVIIIPAGIPSFFEVMSKGFGSRWLGIPIAIVFVGELLFILPTILLYFFLAAEEKFSIPPRCKTCGGRMYMRTEYVSKLLPELKDVINQGKFFKWLVDEVRVPEAHLPDYLSSERCQIIIWDCIRGCTEHVDAFAEVGKPGSTHTRARSKWLFASADYPRVA